MPITADRQKRRSLVTAASTRDHPPSSKTPKCLYPTTPPRRDATMTTLLPRVSPGTRRGERKGSPDALQEGPAAPSGATASVSAKPTGISPDPILHLRHSGARHQTDHHPVNTDTKHPTLSHHGTVKHCLHNEEEEPGLRQQHHRHTGGPHLDPPSMTVADRTQ